MHYHAISTPKKQPFTSVSDKTCFENICKIHEKTPVSVSFSIKLRLEAKGNEFEDWFPQKYPFRNKYFIENCSNKYCKIHMKTPAKRPAKTRHFY